MRKSEPTIVSRSCILPKRLPLSELDSASLRFACKKPEAETALVLMHHFAQNAKTKEQLSAFITECNGQIIRLLLLDNSRPDNHVVFDFLDGMCQHLLFCFHGSLENLLQGLANHGVIYESEITEHVKNHRNRITGSLLLNFIASLPAPLLKRLFPVLQSSSVPEQATANYELSVHAENGKQDKYFIYTDFGCQSALSVHCGHKARWLMHHSPSSLRSAFFQHDLEYAFRYILNCPNEKWIKTMISYVQLPEGVKGNLIVGTRPFHPLHRAVLSRAYLDKEFLLTEFPVDASGFSHNVSQFTDSHSIIPVLSAELIAGRNIYLSLAGEHVSEQADVTAQIIASLETKSRA